MRLPVPWRGAASLAIPAALLVLTPTAIAVADTQPATPTPSAADPAGGPATDPGSSGYQGSPSDQSSPGDQGSPGNQGDPGDPSTPDGQPADGSDPTGLSGQPTAGNPLTPTPPGDSGAPAPAPPLTPPPGIGMRLGHAYLTRSAPAQVRAALEAGNRLQGKPYRWGGGHTRFQDTGYDCSGSVSYLLHAAHLLSAPLDSRGLAHWGAPGPGRWITVYANRGHAFVFVAGLRLDTAGAGPSGPRWRLEPRSLDRFKVRHPPGL